MKTSKYVLNIALGLIIMVSFGCKKYLDVKSDTAQIVPTTLFDLQSLLDNANYLNLSSPSFGMASCDDYFIDANTYNANNIFNKKVYIWEPYPYKFTNDWSMAYRPVYYSNLCLERLQLVVKDQKNTLQWNNVKGSCLYYRSYYFLELAWLFSKAYDAATASTDLGIVLRLGSDFNAPSSRASVAETYERIITDTKEAVFYLPDNPQYLTRPSKCAAYSLLARAYLSKREYDSAGKYSSLALQIKGNLINYNDPTQVDPAAETPFKYFNQETVFYTAMNSVIGLYSPSYGTANVDSVLYNSYDDNDVRKQAFFMPDGDYFSFKGTYSADIHAIFSGITTGELLLVRAECFARAGHKNSALVDLNKLLSNRFISGTFIPFVTTTATEALSLILAERRKELVYRGSLRWMDIKRLNKENAGIVLQRVIENVNYLLPPNDKRYALQIPDDIIQNSGIPQN